MPRQVAKSLDLLVHPFYSISKIWSKFMINSDSERNIQELKASWMDSIDNVIRSQERYMALVNSLDLPDVMPQTEFDNPYRTLYREIVQKAVSELGSRLFYFFPSIPDEPFSVTKFDSGLSEAVSRGNGMLFNPERIIITAYGEHVGGSYGDVCVESSLNRVLTSLGVPAQNSTIDLNRSLPAVPTIRKKGGYFPTDALYLTCTQINKLCDE